MVGTDIGEVRRANLRKLMAQYGGPAALARKLGYSNASFIVQMAGPNPTRGVTEKRCREFEEKLELPQGWFDRPGTGTPALSSPRNGPDAPSLAASTGEVNSEFLGDVIRTVAEVCTEQGVTLSHSKFADLTALIYSEAASSGSLPSVAHIRRLVGLLK